MKRTRRTAQRDLIMRAAPWRLDYASGFLYLDCQQFIHGGIFVKYLVVVSFSFLPAIALAQTAQPPATPSQQTIARVNGDRDLVETALRHYEESVVLNDQSRQGEIAALAKENQSLTEQVHWWQDCTGEKIAGCREWITRSWAAKAK